MAHWSFPSMHKENGCQFITLAWSKQRTENQLRDSLIKPNCALSKGLTAILDVLWMGWFWPHKADRRQRLFQPTVVLDTSSSANGTVQQSACWGKMRAATLNYVIENSSIETHHWVSFKSKQTHSIPFYKSPHKPVNHSCLKKKGKMRGSSFYIDKKKCSDFKIQLYAKLSNYPLLPHVLMAI